MFDKPLTYLHGLYIHHDQFNPVVVHNADPGFLGRVIGVGIVGDSFLNASRRVADVDLEYPVGTGGTGHNFKAPPLLHVGEENTVSPIGGAGFMKSTAFVKGIATSVVAEVAPGI